MPRARKDHGTYNAWRRCKDRPEGACAACEEAHREYNAKRSRSSAKRRGKPVVQAAEVRDEPLAAAPLTDEGHVSRVEILKEMLQESRELVKTLRRNDPQRAYLQMREQREILRELAELQGNGQVKGVTLADQLAEARARRAAEAAAS